MSAKVETKNGTVAGAEKAYETGTDRVERGMAEMQKGGVIMDVVNAEQAKIAEEAGAVAVMALERVPADIRAAGGVARMADPRVIEEVMNAVSIPVMAKARIGHFVEARLLEALGVDYIDESEVLTPADEVYHIDKKQFTVPFVCGARDLGEALRRIGEGASDDPDQGGTGNGQHGRGGSPHAQDDVPDPQSAVHVPGRTDGRSEKSGSSLRTAVAGA